MVQDLKSLLAAQADLRQQFEATDAAYSELGTRLKQLREGVKGVELAVAAVQRRATRTFRPTSKGNKREALFYWAIFVVTGGDIEETATAEDIANQLEKMSLEGGRDREAGRAITIGDLREHFEDAEGVYWEPEGGGYRLLPAAGRVMAAHREKIDGIPKALSAGIPLES